MISAAAYVLKVPESRREILLRDHGSGWFASEDPAVAEPVRTLERAGFAAMAKKRRIW
jgi:hypothetical protein